MFFVIVDSGSKDAFFITDENSVPKRYAGEADAITAAKDYCDDRLILKAVSRLTDKTTTKIEKLK